MGINNKGDIVGYYFDNRDLAKGFILSNGNYTTIDDPLGVLGTLPSVSTTRMRSSDSITTVSIADVS
jgi:hypothetical protein